MSCFLKGMLGGLLAVVVSLFVTAQYSDYRAAAETSGWLNDILPTRDAISANIRRLGTTAGSGLGVAPPSIAQPKPSLLEVMDDGIILLKGGRDGQALTLVPTFAKGEVSWRCIGGPSQATLSCDNWH